MPVDNSITLCPACGAPLKGEWQKGDFITCGYCDSRVRITTVVKTGAVSVPDSESGQQIMNALKEGNKIKAVKAWRTLHGVNLKEAKEAVEKLHAELCIKYPDSKILSGFLFFIVVILPLTGIVLGIVMALIKGCD